MGLSGWPVLVDDSGNGLSGTELAKSVFDAIRASIEAAVFSVTNPTVTAEDIIDEVVQARGSKASLDARLDISLNDDGTLKSSALGTAPTLTQYQNALVNRNLSPNPEMVVWHGGTTAAPTGFSLVGGGATVVRCGFGDADTTQLGTGLHVAKVTRAGTDCYLEWYEIGDLGTSQSRLRNRNVSIMCIVKTAVASQARITIFDGVGSSSSAFHTGGGTAEVLSVTRQLSGSATDLKIRLEVVNSNGAVYFGGNAFIFADVAPTDWNIFTGPASAVGYNGMVNNYEQNWNAIKNFKTHPTLTPGFSDDMEAAMVAGHHYTNITPVGNIGGGTDDLMSTNLPANFLGAPYPATPTRNLGPEMAVKVTASFNVANNGTAKTLTFVFNGVTVATATLRTATADPALAEFWIVRTGLNTQRIFGFISHAGGSGAANYQVNINTTGAATETGAIAVKFQGAAGANDDIQQTSMKIGHGTI